MDKYKHQDMIINWYANMYAWYHQQAYTRLELRAHFLNKAEQCMDYWLLLTKPITINEILTP